ncbi:MAG TPA: anthranilate phosphoribosyltransferase [Alphaproteobacteria bacterium]|nr:anthranilate phosphoribosyltransferase [Alphaproteobacteria bacterium]
MADSTHDSIGLMLDGKLDDVEISAFLTGLNQRGFTKTDILGAAKAMRERMTVFEGAQDAVDVCGTGGDRHGTLNVSTAVGFVLASGGVRVVKHGNRAVSSQSGSTDVLTALGIKTDVAPAVMQKALSETNFCYLAAPLYHPSMKRVAEIRKKIGRTIFNLLGPLANPARVKKQLVGVFDAGYVKTFAEILKELGSTQAIIVHGKDGLDEATTTMATDLAELKNGAIETRAINASDFGLPAATLKDLQGGSADYNAKRLKQALQGEKGPYTDIIRLNAGLGFAVAHNEDIAGGVARATKLLENGTPAETLARFARLTHE